MKYLLKKSNKHSNIMDAVVPMAIFMIARKIGNIQLIKIL
jgi:hypothetical protein